MNQVNGSVHFFFPVLTQKGEREGTESEKVEKENPREARP